MAYSFESLGRDCYPGTTVLGDKPDIRGQSKLDFSAADGDEIMLATIHAASGAMDTLLQAFDPIITVSRQGR